MAKKVVLKLDLHDDKDKQKALRAVSKLQGLDSIAMDMKDKKLTAIGLIDPIDVVNKLRKLWHTEIVSVGPAKEPEKKKEDNKDEQKKDQNNGKKEGGGGDKKKEASDPIADYINAHRNYYNPHVYNPHMTPYYVQSSEENPNACVIC